MVTKLSSKSKEIFIILFKKVIIQALLYHYNRIILSQRKIILELVFSREKKHILASMRKPILKRIVMMVILPFKWSFVFLWLIGHHRNVIRHLRAYPINIQYSWLSWRCWRIGLNLALDRLDNHVYNFFHFWICYRNNDENKYLSE